MTCNLNSPIIIEYNIVDKIVIANTQTRKINESNIEIPIFHKFPEKCFVTLLDLRIKYKLGSKVHTGNANIKNFILLNSKRITAKRINIPISTNCICRINFFKILFEKIRYLIFNDNIKAIISVKKNIVVAVTE